MADDEMYGDVDMELLAAALSDHLASGETNMALVVLAKIDEAREMALHDVVQARQQLNRIKFLILRVCPLLNPESPPADD